MKVDLNTTVRVTLTNRGWAAYNQLRDRERRWLDRNLTMNGVLQLPLWLFAYIFGPSFDCGCANSVAAGNQVELIADRPVAIIPAALPLRQTTVKKGRRS